MRKFLLLGVAAASIATVSNANALPLSYDIAVNGVSIGSGSDLTDGFVTFAASGSGFSVTGTASSAPALNSPDFSSNTFNFQNKNGGAGTLTVRITDTSLTAFTGNVANQFTLNPQNGASFTNATISNYVDASNTAFGTATLLATTGLITNNPPAGATIAAISMPGLFSETTIYTLTFSAGGPSAVQASSSLNSVPEPMSLALLGSGLATVGLIRRKRA